MEKIGWVTLDLDAGARIKAQRSAAKTQHQISYGVQNLYMPQSDQPKITLLAEELQVPYDRLHKMLTGRVVMQLEDIGRLRELIGAQLDLWFLRDDFRGAVELAQLQLARLRGPTS